MKAVILAGGEGTRLRPLTLGRPKPMIPLVHRPVLEHLLLLLRGHGITEVLLTVQYQARRIQDYFGDGAALGMRLQYSVEEVPLGTAGAVKRAAHLLDETFLVLSGDALTDIDLTALVDYHRDTTAVATLALTRVANPLGYGVVTTDPSGHIRRFLEKPSWGEVVSDTINTGIYVLEPAVLRQCPAGRPGDFSQDLFPALLARGQPLYGYVASGYWTDVGTLDEYARACFDVLHGRVQVEVGAPSERPGVWCEQGADIAADAQLSGPIYLGAGAQIGPGVVIEGPAVIGAHTRVARQAHIAHSILWPGCSVGERADLRGALVGARCMLAAHSVLCEGAVVGDACRVGAGARLEANVRIWPDKEIEAGATVSSSVVWGQRGQRRLFRGHSVGGVANQDVTPEFAARLGAAVGTTLPPGSTVAVNRDLSRTSRMLKRALIAGLSSAGINVRDCASVPLPVFRHAVRTSPEVSGGVHVRLNTQDGRLAEVQVLDTTGQDIALGAEHAIETHVFREEIRRARPTDLGVIGSVTDAVGRYRQAVLALINVTQIRAARFRLVVDYRHGPTAAVLPDLLDLLGCSSVALDENVQDNVPGAPAEGDLAAPVRRVGAVTVALGLDLGAVIDSSGETLLLTDDRGQSVPPLVVGAVMEALAFQAQAGISAKWSVVAPPIHEQMATQQVGTFGRTPAGPSARAPSGGGVLVACDAAGRLIIPRLQPTADALMGLLTLLDLLAVTGSTLRQAVGALPAYVQSTTEVPCPWERTSVLMRALTARAGAGTSRAGAGVHIAIGESEWVLVLPDAERPLVHIVGAAPSQRVANTLVETYAGIVRDLQRA